MTLLYTAKSAMVSRFPKCGRFVGGDNLEKMVKNYMKIFGESSGGVRKQTNFRVVEGGSLVHTRGNLGY